MATKKVGLLEIAGPSREYYFFDNKSHEEEEVRKLWSRPSHESDFFENKEQEEKAIRRLWNRLPDLPKYVGMYCLRETNLYGDNGKMIYIVTPCKISEKPGVPKNDPRASPDDSRASPDPNSNARSNVLPDPKINCGNSSNIQSAPQNNMENENRFESSENAFFKDLNAFFKGSENVDLEDPQINNVNPILSVHPNNMEKVNHSESSENEEHGIQIVDENRRAVQANNMENINHFQGPENDERDIQVVYENPDRIHGLDDPESDMENIDDFESSDEDEGYTSDSIKLFEDIDVPYGSDDDDDDDTPQYYHQLFSPDDPDGSYPPGFFSD